MKALLVNPPWYRREGNIWREVNTRLPPLGISYIAAYLERQGISVEVLDAQAEQLHVDSFPDRLAGKDFDVIGITSTTPIFYRAIDSAKILKKLFPKAKLVMGGVHPSALPEEALACEDVDMVVIGEGEKTLLEIIQGKKPSEIPGLAFRVDNGEMVKTPDRPLINDLDGLPHPAYHLLPMQRYRPALGGYRRLPAVQIMASRGCTHRCTFCFPVFGNTARFRSVDSIIDEIKLLVKDFGMKEIYFYDDTFNLNRKLLAGICEALIREELDITWACLARADLVDLEILKLMKRSRCHAISFGVESADPEILDNIKKQLDLSKVGDAVEMCRKVGIESRLGFMMGNPGETRETLEHTIRFCIDLNPDLAMFNITTPFPGTQIYEWADERGYLRTKDWETYDFSTAVMDLPDCPHELVEHYQREGHKRYFLRPGFIFGRFLKIRSWLDFKINMIAFLSLSGIKPAIEKIIGRKIYE